MSIIAKYNKLKYSSLLFNFLINLFSLGIIGLNVLLFFVFDDSSTTSFLIVLCLAGNTLLVLIWLFHYLSKFIELLSRLIGMPSRYTLIKIAPLIRFELKPIKENTSRWYKILFLEVMSVVFVFLPFIIAGIYIIFRDLI